MGCFVLGEKSVGIFCAPRQISVGCFVHPGEVVWNLLSTLQNMAWELSSMGSFVWLPGNLCLNRTGLSSL